MKESQYILDLLHRYIFVYICDILHIPLYLLVNREMIIIYSVGGDIEWREIEYLERESLWEQME